MYVKLFTSIYQGTLRGKPHCLLVFTNLLAHADSHGVVDVHPNAIADEVGISPDEVKQTLLILEEPDIESRSPEAEGRRIVRLDGHRAWGWQIVNYVKYRAIKNEDDRREQNRAAQERWRNKNKPASAEVSSVSPDKPMQKQKQMEKQSSESKDSGGKPPMTPEDIIFGYGVPLLTNAGATDKHARSFLGGLRKAHGDTALVNMLRECIRAKPLQPMEWLAAAMLPDAVGASETRHQKAQREKMMRDFPNLFPQTNEVNHGPAALLG